jgi:hypothetical protein
MAQDIVSGIFGLTPYEVQQQQQNALNQQAADYASRSLMQRGDMALYQGGAGLANLGAGMFGMQNPAIAQAQAREAAIQGVDFNDPKAIYARAQQVQDPRVKIGLIQLAQGIEAKKAEAGYKTAMEQRALAQSERELAMAEKAARGEPDLKYATPVEKLQAARDKLPIGDPRRKELDDAIRRANYIEDKNPAAKPLPAPVVKMQNDVIDAASLSSNIESDLAAIRAQISEGKLNLSTMNNLMNKVRNGLNLSNEESRNLASFTATLERLRNDSLRLNKGPQTEGDAQRAWNEFLTSLGDTELANRRLDEIIRVNARAVEKETDKLNLMRANFGHDPIDLASFVKKPAAVGAEKKQPSKPVFEARTQQEVKSLYRAGKLSESEAIAIIKDMRSQGVK